LYGCKTWSFTLREKNTGWGAGLKKIVRPRNEEAAGEWRKLHSEELHSFYSSPNVRIIVSKRMI
jgi:hypothetical protein